MRIKMSDLEKRPSPRVRTGWLMGKSGEFMEFTVNDSQYLWWDGDLYAKSEGGGDTLYPFEGSWVRLLDCEKEDAIALAEQDEAAGTHETTAREAQVSPEDIKKQTQDFSHWLDQLEQMVLKAKAETKNQELPGGASKELIAYLNDTANQAWFRFFKISQVRRSK